MDTEKAGSPCLNVARWVERSEANGPGTRFVLWLQGCPLHCVGCWNPDTWDPARGTRMTVDEIMRIIAGVRGIQGVTISGGEPFAQADALEHLTRCLRGTGLSLMIFTGYELDELCSPAARNVLAITDIIVAGRFVLAERDLSLRWRGSRNQRVHYLSNRYSPDLECAGADVEVLIANNGEVRITGFPEAGLISSVRASHNEANRR